MSETDDREPVGSVAEEAAKLFGAFSGWAKEHGDGLSSFADDLHDHVATGSAECTWCPVCRTIAAVRQTSPEVRAHLAPEPSNAALRRPGAPSVSHRRSDCKASFAPLGQLEV